MPCYAINSHDIPVILPVDIPMIFPCFSHHVSTVFSSQDIIEDGEERLEVEMDFEDSLRTLSIADGWLAAEDTKSGAGGSRHRNAGENK